MSNSIPPANPVGTHPNAVANRASPIDEPARMLAIRRVELASLSRHLDRLRRRQREQEDHLTHTRRQVDALMERSRQQIAQVQSGSPERIAELEKSLVQARNDVEAQRREVARLAGEKAQAATKTQELEKALTQARGEAARLVAEKSNAEPLAAKVVDLEKAIGLAKSDAEAQRWEVTRLSGEKANLERTAAKTAELEKALAQARNDVEAQRREAARLAGEKVKLEQAVGQPGKLAELEQALGQARAQLESQRTEVARMTADRTQAAAKSSQLEQALTLAQSELVATRQQIDDLQQASSRIAELEELLTEAAAELEARDRQISSLSSGEPPAVSTSTPGVDFEKIVAEVRAELDELHQAEFQRLNLDIEALRKGNTKLRQELQLLQGDKDKNGVQPAQTPAVPAEELEKIKKENEELKARQTAIEISVQKLFEDNQKLRASVLEVEQERDTAIESMEREAAQFNRQRRMLEEELTAARTKLESGDNGDPIFPTTEPEAAESPSVEIMAGFIVPEPNSKDVIDIEAPLSAPMAAVNFDDGFDFARCEAELVALQSLVETDHHCLDLELSDPATQRAERQLADLEQQKITIDSLLHQVRRSRDALAGSPSSPPVVVAPPQPHRQKPRSTLQGLRKWLKGRE